MLTCDLACCQELYSRQYDCVGVLFASIPNFDCFYSEDINKGLECIRVLNEIIGKFYVYTNSAKRAMLLHEYMIDRIF